MYIKAKLKDSISGQTGMRISGQVYYTKNYKKTDFTNLGYHIREGNDETLTRPENLNLNSRGGGNKLHKDGNQRSHITIIGTILTWKNLKKSKILVYHICPKNG